MRDTDPLLRRTEYDVVMSKGFIAEDADPLTVIPEEPRTWSATPVNDRKVWFLAAGVAGAVLVLLAWMALR